MQPQGSSSRRLPLSPNSSMRSSSYSAPRRSSSGTVGVGVGGIMTGAGPTMMLSGGGLAQSMAKSMTLDEMRVVHQRALRDAEAKRMELRLVLASRYRELVGSSDEVIKMNERAAELLDLVQNLPQLLDRVANAHAHAHPHPSAAAVSTQEEKLELDFDVGAHDEENDARRVNAIRVQLANYPRLIHRALHKKDVFLASTTLLDLFTLIASLSDRYPLATSLSRMDSKVSTMDRTLVDETMEAQLRMLFLQMESLPAKLRRDANRMLENENVDAKQAAAAAATLYLLNKRDNNINNDNTTDPEALLTSYFEAKAKLTVEALGKLNQAAENAEVVLTKIVAILQMDVIIHPYQIFVLRNLDVGNDALLIASLPYFDKETVKEKCSKFLAAHLPMIRSKVKTVLVSIAGTTASALGQIRQSLYDKTDGSTDRLKTAAFTWDEAVYSMVDLRNTAESTTKFSLWSSLFSTTFSSLVHSLLTTAFQSVHSNVISTLKDALANAPSGVGGSVLPHEAYRNTLKIAKGLDKSLQKVKEDAHELLVHAEERVESERRLRQSLFVQTSEILGRLLSDVRCMALQYVDEPVKDLIVGRLCFHLKYRLTCLQSLLSADSSPTTVGMISFVDLESAFELADDDEDGVIPYIEARGVIESAFAGSPFKANEMIQETSKNGSFTLAELALLSARGMHHDKTGSRSALGTFQSSLDAIVDRSFRRWSRGIIDVSLLSLKDSINDFVVMASDSTSEEWRRVFRPGDDGVKSVSPYIVGFMLKCSMCLNENLCPTDNLSPLPKSVQASVLGIDDAAITTCGAIIRNAVATQAIKGAITAFRAALASELDWRATACAEAKLLLLVDVLFLKMCADKSSCRLGDSLNDLLLLQQSFGSILDRQKQKTVEQVATEKLAQVASSGHVFLSSLFGYQSIASSTSESTAAVAESSDPLYSSPLPPSRRFALLPVQADRSLSDLEIRGKYAREKKEATSNKQDTNSGNAISSGFGFLSGMLKGTGRK